MITILDLIDPFGLTRALTSETPLPPVNVIPMQRPHRLGPAITIDMSEAPDRTAQYEQTCKRCGMVRIEVHAKDGMGFVEWRWPREHLQWRSTGVPPCEPGDNGKAR
jgi:hypothetical protein